MNAIKLMFGVAAVATAGGTVLLAAGPAAARDVTVVASLESGVPVARVSFADLNLANAAGQETLRRRVGGAIRTVCAPAYDGTEPTRFSNCQNDAWSEAKPQMAAAVARASRLAAGQGSEQDRQLAMSASIRFGGR